MGSSNSKSIASIVNEVSASVIVNQMQQCSASTVQDQVLDSSFSILFFFKQSQTSTINQQCLSNFKVDNTLVANIANKIQQTAQNEGVALLDALRFNSSETNLYLKNAISSNITTNLIQKTLTNVSQKQRSNFLFSISLFSSFEQSSSVFQKALAEAVASTNLATDISSKSSQEATNKQTNPFDFISNTIMYIVLFFAFIILIVIGGAIYLLSEI